MTGLSQPTHQEPYFEVKSADHPAVTSWPLRWLQQAKTSPADLILTEDNPLPPSKRLVVILPDEMIDAITLPRRISELAMAGNTQVLLVIKTNKEKNEFLAQVNLATLAAVIRDAHVSVETQLVLGSSLERALHQFTRPGDIFVCFGQHRITRWLRTRRLADILARQERKPVYTLSGPVFETIDPVTASLANVLILAACLVTLLLFSYLQVWIDRNFTGGITTLLFSLSVVVEIGIVGKIAGR